MITRTQLRALVALDRATRDEYYQPSPAPTVRALRSLERDGLASWIPAGTYGERLAPTVLGYRALDRAREWGLL